MPVAKICIIGDVVVDVTLKSETEQTKLRLGGIIHAARGLWALNIPFSVGYFAPEYLDGQIVSYLDNLGATDSIKLGNVTGAPYVFLIQEAKEVGDQGYEFLLRDDIKVNYDADAIQRLINSSFEHYILISGNYEQDQFINTLNGKIHIDVANNINDLSFFDSLTKKVDTLFISTSSTIFQNYFKEGYRQFVNLFESYANQLILKENRGGSRGVDFITQKSFSASSQTIPIIHSVGVGDVFDVCYVANYQSLSNVKALILASWIACEYALTTFPDDFKTGAKRVLKADIDQLVNLKGVSLPWEERKKINIYIAAPDFSFVNTDPIEKLVQSLQYHNFKPRRPILENGQMEQDATKSRKQELFQKDMILLDQCSILIAVLLYNDPGTLIEIGLASARGIPTFVYDPYKQAENCMLTELPTLVSHDLDTIITEVFVTGAHLLHNEK